jgi:hypothetical protein
MESGVFATTAVIQHLEREALGLLPRSFGTKIVPSFDSPRANFKNTARPKSYDFGLGYVRRT